VKVIGDLGGVRGHGMSGKRSAKEPGRSIRVLGESLSMQTERYKP